MINISYKIVEVWPDSHSIVARYWTDIISEEFLASDDQRNDQGKPIRCRSDVAITLPIPAPQGSELEKIILMNAPKNWLQLLHMVNDPNVDTNLDSIQSLIGINVSKSSEEFTKIIDPDIPAQLTDEEITDLIEKLNGT